MTDGQNTNAKTGWGKAAAAAAATTAYARAAAKSLNACPNNHPESISIKGGGIMVMARAVESYLQGVIEKRRKQWRERWRKEGREQGREEGLEQGIEQGRETLAAEVADWNRRRLDAEERGQPFDEPPPGV